MALKSVHDNVLDAALDYIATADVINVCKGSSVPTYAAAIGKIDSSGQMLAAKAISGSDFTGPSDGDTSGRKLAVNAQSSLSINGIASSSDSATHVALTKASGSELVYVTTCTPQSLTAGNKVNTPAWDIEIRDPA
jgi:hypothetical protein